MPQILPLKDGDGYRKVTKMDNNAAVELVGVIILVAVNAIALIWLWSRTAKKD